MRIRKIRTSAGEQRLAGNWRSGLPSGARGPFTRAAGPVLPDQDEASGQRPPTQPRKPHE